MTPDEILNLLDQCLTESLAISQARREAELAPADEVTLMDEVHPLECKTFLAEPLAPALEAVEAMREPLTRDQAALWLPWMLRWLYSSEHLFSIFQGNLSLGNRTELDIWKGELRAEHRQAMGIEGDETPANCCGPLERLELALLKGPLREAAQDPTIQLAWAGSALQEQNLPLFKAFEVDRALLLQIMGAARSIFYNMEQEKILEETWNKASVLAMRQNYVSGSETSETFAGLLWLEWVHNSNVHEETLVALLEAGVYPYTTFDCSTGWMGVATRKRVFDRLVQLADPLDPQHSLEIRLSAFQGLGPAVREWKDHTNIKFSGGKLCHWLLGHAKTRWLQWSAHDQQLAMESWQCQALACMSTSGEVPDFTMNTPKAMEYALKWQDKGPWASKPKEFLNALYRREVPLPRWVFPDGKTMTLSAGYCRTALPNMTPSQVKLDMWFAGKPPDEPEHHTSGEGKTTDDVWRFLFQLGVMNIEPTFMRWPYHDGEMLADAFREIMENRWEERVATALAETAVQKVLFFRATEHPAIPASCWKGLESYLPELAYHASGYGSFSFKWMKRWMAQVAPLTREQGTLQARTLLNALKEDESYLGTDMLHTILEKLTALWTQWPGLGPCDDKPHMQKLWTKVIGVHPAVEAAWKRAHLTRTLAQGVAAGARARL